MIKQNTKSNTKHPLSQSLPHTSRLHPPRLSFFGKGITFIDRLQTLPQSFLLQIKQLDLSHNAIVKLQNIKQFPNLQIINLAHNYINDGRQIVKLTKLHKLKNIMVKGNPFWKSGQGLMQAIRFLIRYDIDVPIFSNKTQALFMQILKKYCLLQMKKQYLLQIQNKIQFIAEYPLVIAQGISEQYHNNFIQIMLLQKIQQFYIDFRKELINQVLKQQNQQIQLLDSKQQLDKYFVARIKQYEQKIHQQLGYQQKKIKQGLQLLKHAQIMKKGKQRKQDIISVFKKINKKPLFSKNQNRQNIIKNPNRYSPKKNPKHQIQLQNVRTSPKKIKYQLTNQISFESYYSSMLSKNPVYQLLYSPLTSLKNKQKDLLIQTLSTHLKQLSYTVYKNQKLKQQYQKLNKFYQQKQRLLKLGEQKFLQYKISMGERVNYLQQILNQKDIQLKYLKQKFDKYQSDNYKLQQRNQYLQEQLSQYKLKIIKQSTALQKYSNSDQVFDTIQMMRQKNIKKSYLSMLVKKSSQLSRFHQAQIRNKFIQEKQLLSYCFKFIQKQTENNKKVKIVKRKLEQNKNKQIINCFIQNSMYLLKSKKCNQMIKKIKKAKFVNFLQKQYLILKQNKNRVHKIIQNSNKKLTVKCFQNWKIQTQQRKNLDNVQKAQIFYNYILKQKMFKNWRIFVKLPIHQQAELSVDLKTNKMGKFISLLHINYIENKAIQEKFINLIVFLNKNRRIKYFFKFKQYAVLNSQHRNCKQNNVSKVLKLKYFYQVLKTLAQNRNKKKEQYQKNMKLLNLRKKSIFDKLNSEGYSKYTRRKKFVNLIQIYRKRTIADSLRQSLKQFMVEDTRNKNDLKTFFNLIQIKNKNRLKLENKTNQLKLFLNKNRTTQNYQKKKQFFNIFLEPSKQKAKLIHFLDKKYYKIMLKHFNQWRIQLFKNQIQYLKIRISQFGPQIQQITKRQRTVYEQKQVLMNIIETKQKTIKDYVKQLQQAEYTINAKQTKYLKLKDFLHESGQDGLTLNSKFQSGDKRIPERDYDTFLLQDQKDYFESFRRF